MNIGETTKKYLTKHEGKSPETILYDIFMELKNVQDPKEWHPEENVQVHLMQSAEMAIRSFPRKLTLVQAAFCHDIGKIIKSHGHDKYGAEILHFLRNDEGFSINNRGSSLRQRIRADACYLVRHHMRVYDFSKNMGIGKRLKFIDDYMFTDFMRLFAIDRHARKKSMKLESFDYYFEHIVLNHKKYFDRFYKP